MSKILPAALLLALVLSCTKVVYQHGYDAGVAAGYRELSDRVLAGLRDRREADADDDQQASP